MTALVLALLSAAPEFSFEAPGPLVRAPGSTYELSVASNDILALVVWTANGRWGIGRSAVYAARVDSAGKVLDPEGLFLADEPNGPASVAWLPAANAFVVAWGEESRLFLRLIRADGTFHPATPAPLEFGQGRRPFVTANGGRFMVTAESSTPVMWRFVAPATQVDATGVTLGNAISNATPVRGAVMSAPSAVVSWAEDSRVMAAMVSLDSAGPAPVLLPTLLTAPAPVSIDGLKANAAEARVLFRVNVGATPVLAMLRFSSAGALLPEAFDAGPTPVSGANLSAFGNGLGYGVLATVQSGEVLGWLVSDAGSVSAGPVATGANDGAATPLGALELVATTSWGGGIMAQLTSQQFAPLGMPFQVSTSRGAHQGARVAASAQGYVATWLRLTDDADLVTWQVSTDAGRAAAADQVLASSRYASPSLVSYAGGAALLVDQSTVRLMNASGAWSTRDLPRALAYGSLSTDRAGRLVGVGLQYNPMALHEGWALRLEPDGGFLERVVFPVDAPKPYKARAAFARDGSGGLVISNWSQQVWANRLTPELVPLDDAGFLLVPPPAVDALVGADPQGGYLVATSNSNDIDVRRLEGQVVSAPQRVLAGEWSLSDLAEVPQGVLVVATSRESARVVVVLVRVVGGAIVVDPPVSVASGGAATNFAGVAVRPDGFCFTYGRLEPDAGVATTHYQVWSSLPGASCAQAWQCGAGACVAGVCEAVDAGGAGGGSSGAGGGSSGAGGGRGGAGGGSSGAGGGSSGAGGGSSGAGGGGSGEGGGSGSAADGGVGPGTYVLACGCQESGGSTSLLLGLLVALAARRRSRAA